MFKIRPEREKSKDIFHVIIRLSHSIFGAEFAIFKWHEYDENNNNEYLCPQSNIHHTNSFHALKTMKSPMKQDAPKMRFCFFVIFFQ